MGEGDADGIHGKERPKSRKKVMRSDGNLGGRVVRRAVGIWASSSYLRGGDDLGVAQGSSVVENVQERSQKEKKDDN